MANGYMGKVLWVDVARNILKDEVLDDKFCRDYIGGYGFGASKLFSMMKPDTDPLGPDNILGFMTGPFTGTPAISPSRYTVFCKSPLTHGWGDANSGGDFGPKLKYAGYDGVYFTGISDKPVYLYIENGKAEIRDAVYIWGKDTYETEKLLKQQHGASTSVCCIGPSGENLSLIAGIMNNHGRCAARSGVGAVMGSKRLKAIAVNGNQTVPLANPARAIEVNKKNISSFKISPLLTDVFRTVGTPGAMVHSCLSGDSPVKNWGGVGVVDFPNVLNISGEVVMSKQDKKYGCYRCPLACGGIMKGGTEYSYQAGSHKPEYETLAGFGSMCLNDNIESIIMANDICNRFGVDTISVAGTISFAIECYENSIISSDDTDGIEMKWGNHRAIVAMTEKLVKREGFGAVLADGVKVAAEKIGKGSDKYAMHIGGQELPMHDPRANWHHATTYRMDATFARHTQSAEAYAAPGVYEPYDPKNFSGRGVAHLRSMAMSHIMNTAGMCLFVYMCFPHINVMVETMNAITGWETDLESLIKVGNRITTIRHAFNLREGINPLNLPVPGRILGRPPLPAGPTAGIEVNEAVLIRDYLTAEDWDLETAMPSKKKLDFLGLHDIASELYKNVK